MQVVKNVTKGQIKKEKALKNEKDFDLDRRRDSEDLIAMDSLTTEDKTITYFDTEELDLFYDIDLEKSYSKWISDGEVNIVLAKSSSNKK